MSDTRYKRRLDRLKELGETFAMRYGRSDKPWPIQPGRFAVKSFSEQYGEAFWEAFDDRAGVEAEVLTGDVWRIVDLDTGEDVEYELTATVAWPELREPAHRA